MYVGFEQGLKGEQGMLGIAGMKGDKGDYVSLNRGFTSCMLICFLLVSKCLFSEIRLTVTVVFVL